MSPEKTHLNFPWDHVSSVQARSYSATSRMASKPIPVPSEAANASHTLWVWPGPLLHHRARCCLGAETPAPTHPSSPQRQPRGYSTLGRKVLGSHLQINHQCAWSSARASNKLLTAIAVKYLCRLLLPKFRLKDSTGYTLFISTAELMDRLGEGPVDHSSRSGWALRPAASSRSSVLPLQLWQLSPARRDDPPSSNHRKVDLLRSWGSFLWLPKRPFGSWDQH